MAKKLISSWLDSYQTPDTHVILDSYRFGGGGAPFSPSDLAGLTLWLKADAIVGLSDSDPISTWSDSSGSSNDATAALTLRPTYKTSIINSLPVARFNGSLNFLTGTSLSLSQPLTLFLLGSIDTTSGGNSGIFDGTGGARCLLVGFGGSNQVQLFAGGFDNAVSYTASTVKAFSAIYNGSSSELRVNGGTPASGNPGTNSLGVYVIGKYSDSTPKYPMDIAEVIVYNSALNSTDRGKVETYLGAKYSLF